MFLFYHYMVNKDYHCPTLSAGLADCSILEVQQQRNVFICRLNNARIIIRTIVTETNSVVTDTVYCSTRAAAKLNDVHRTTHIRDVSQAKYRITESTTKESFSEMSLTLRKGIEVTLLSHLQYVNPTDSSAKRMYIKRAHAASLTSAGRS